MPRDIDDRKRQKALRKLRKAAELAEQGLGPPLSDWEQQFLEEVEERIETYGSAFADPDKGDLDEPLSAMQTMKLKEIDKKARGKGGGGFKQRKPLGSKSKPEKKTNWSRDIHEDTGEEASVEPPAPKTKPKLAEVPRTDDQDTPTEPTPRPQKRPVFRVIDGGKSD